MNIFKIIFIFLFISKKIINKLLFLSKKLINKLLLLFKITYLRLKNFLFVSIDYNKEYFFFIFLFKIKKAKKKIKKSGINFAKSIKFKKEENPKISIIIPVYKNELYTLLCLYSISIAKSNIPFQIIIIDDSGINNFIDSLNYISNIKVIRNQKNLGYLKSCNKAINTVNSEFVYLLNNDTYVIDYWLDSLINTFDFFPDVGVVGSKMYYDDLTVQECGSYIFSNGEGYNFGRQYHDSSSILNYTREVDYCSASSILIKKQDFSDLGMFDEDYIPAYYEDVDLCFKFKSIGKKVLCNPKSKIFHFESKTLGEMLSQKDILMKKNKSIFLKKWQSSIPKGFNKITNLEEIKKTIIFFEESVITPYSDAGSLSIFNFAKLFQELGYVVIFKFMNLDYDTDLLENHGFHVIKENIDWSQKNSLKILLKEFYIYPSIFYVARPALYESLSPFLRRDFPKTLMIYDTVDLHFLRMERESKIKKSKWSIDEIMTVKKMELANIQNADLSVIRSSYERNLLIDKYNFKQKNFINLSLLYKTQKTIPTFQDTEGIVFVANFLHIPNVDALNYFFNEIVNHFSKKLLNVNIHIVGKNGKKIFGKKDLLPNNVIFHDFISDIDLFLSRRRVNIAPLRYGAGIKGKIAQAMTIGIPTISTTIGFEGMDLKSKNSFCTNDPKNFAELIDLIYHDQMKWTYVRTIQHKYSNIWSRDFNLKLLQIKLKNYIQLPNKLFTTNLL